MLQVLVAISQKFCCRKETWGYAKVIHKKVEEIRVEKMDKLLRYLKQWVLRCPPKKREEKDEYDSPCFLAKLFLNSKSEMFSRIIVELG